LQAIDLFKTLKANDKGLTDTRLPDLGAGRNRTMTSLQSVVRDGVLPASYHPGALGLGSRMLTLEDNIRYRPPAWGKSIFSLG
jgi:hypothetical protein